LRFALQDRAVQSSGLWLRLFSDWVPNRRAEAEGIALATTQRAASRVELDSDRSEDREAVDLQRWLLVRATDICGTYVPPTGDLFGIAAHAPDWETLAAPLDRLAAFAADGGIAPGKRREANSVVELYQRRGQERAARAIVSPLILRPVGMLMLAPLALAS
jgi:hypothetical protein